MAKTDSRKVASVEEVETWIRAAAEAADDKAATDIVVLSVGDVLGVADFFLICSGASNRQVRTIANAVEEGVRLVDGPRPRSREGSASREWVLLDFGDLIAHVFSTEAREFYDLERLWSDVDRFDWRQSS